MLLITVSNSYIIKVARPLCLSGALGKSWINSAVVKRFFSPALAIWWARWCCHFVSYSALVYLKPCCFPLFLRLNFIIVQVEGSARRGGQAAVAFTNVAAAHTIHDGGVKAHRSLGSSIFSVWADRASSFPFWGDWRWTSTKQANSHDFVFFSFVGNMNLPATQQPINRRNILSENDKIWSLFLLTLCNLKEISLTFECKQMTINGFLVFRGVKFWHHF